MSGRVATYVCAVVGVDTDLPVDLEPIGGSPEGVAVVEHRDLAAVVSDIRVDEPLGRRADLVAHERVVNTIAEEATVLPMRFGGVLSDDRAVVDDLLGGHHDWFVRALAGLDGCVESVLRGRYDAVALFGHILEQNQEVARLTAEVRDRAPDAAHHDRVRLGGAIAREVEGARAVDATTAEQWLGPYVEAAVGRGLDDEDDAVHLALLVRRDRRPAFEQVVDSLGDEWASRIGLCLIGPVVPFDFVPDPDKRAWVRRTRTGCSPT